MGPNAPKRGGRWSLALAAATATLALLGGVVHAATVNLKVADTSATGGLGALPSSVDFYFTIEEDKTFDVKPGVTAVAGADGDPARSDPTLSLAFHRSYMPVVASGEGMAAFTAAVGALDFSQRQRYFVSVLPKAVDGTPAYTMGGTPLRGQTEVVDLVLHPLPIKTAQISVLIFQDNNPINGAPDAPSATGDAQELGLCGFEAQLFDAGGTYGASGGRISADVFGNPLGTVYNAAGEVVSIGDNVLKADRNGVIAIKNLAPAKYTIFPLAPNAMPSRNECNLGDARRTPIYVAENAPGPLQPGQIRWGEWMQTTTIEGTWGNDAWVNANEPNYFKEFGPPGHHVFQGFVRKFNGLASNQSSAVTATGRIVHTHMSRPPALAFYNGEVDGECSIGINEVGVQGGLGVWAGPCNALGEFSIPNLKPGTRYQLAVWDGPLDNVFGQYDFYTPDSGGALALGDVPVFRWFGRFEGKVCHDYDGSGRCTDATGTDDSAKSGLPNQAINLRFRDGSIYQSVVTNDDGEYEFAEVFPFFNWLVAEVDFARFKATGATMVTDAGGALPASNTASYVWGHQKMTPQVQDNGAPYRTDLSASDNPDGSSFYNPVLLQAEQIFLGTTNRIDWGKKAYAGVENGGITGIVHYASTRAEFDPRFATAENNEPGIPGVTVNLYRASAANPRQRASNTPIASTVTDAWDDAQPTGCAWSTSPAYVSPDGIVTDCYDGLRNYNQQRPGVFDGGYAFFQYQDPVSNTYKPLEAGYYIVEVVSPKDANGNDLYVVQKEEDKNVDFGDLIEVSTLAYPVECVGERSSPVPAELALFPGVGIPFEFRDNPVVDADAYPANYAASGGKKRPYCNMKAVTLMPRMNAAADFHLFTHAPVSGHIVGMILDDLANEFSVYNPSFGEKYAPPFMPISLRDWSGREFSRVYSDRFGTYNALVPSTFSYNVPIPSGVSPSMIQACLNSPYMADPANPGKFKLDPHFNKSYTQFCYTLQYLPGKTTYLDTPVLPIAAFAGPQQYPLDCEQPDQTPAIHSVTNGNYGPWVSRSAGGTLTIKSMGATEVLNPLFNQDDLGVVNPATGVVEPRTIARNYGFGSVKGKVSIGGVDVSNFATWSDAQITLTLPPGTPVASGTLVVTHANGKSTTRGVTVHIENPTPTVLAAGQTIQSAVDAAAAGALIIVPPGVYEESVIVDRRVRLQGHGAGATMINAVKQPTEKLQLWRQAMCLKIMASGGADFLVPGQTLPANLDACLTGDTADAAPLLFGTEEGAGFFVMEKRPASTNALNNLVGNVLNGNAPRLQIDGFTITGADQGEGVMVNGNAVGIEISNNRITGNAGSFSGGIRLGHFELTSADRYTDAYNYLAKIHDNEILQNGNQAGESGGGGGGIGLYTGSNAYTVSNNFVCGNYSTGDGGGLAHVGISDVVRRGNTTYRNTISGNKFLFNQSFYQGRAVNGGGISIAGLPSLLAANGASTGSGPVRIANNLLQGNLAGAGDGGGISLVGVNGTENGNDPYRVDILNNVIVDNVTGLAGGGIAMQDATSVYVINNTITHNDSVATAGLAFTLGQNDAYPGGVPNAGQNSVSAPQPGAGIASRGHSSGLAARVGNGYSNPTLVNNIVLENRQYRWGINYLVDQTTCTFSSNTVGNCYGLNFVGFSDLGVLGAPGNPSLNPTYSALTSAAPGNNVVATTANTAGCQASASGTPVRFLADYCNAGRDAVIQMTEQQVNQSAGSLATAAAFDEGGNFIDTRFGPLTLNDAVAWAKSAPGARVLRAYGDYRLANNSGVGASGRNLTNVGTIPQDIRVAVSVDAAGVPRGSAWAIGAYEPQP